MKARYYPLLLILVALILLTQACTFEEYFYVAFGVVLQHAVPKNKWYDVTTIFLERDFEIQAGFVYLGGQISDRNMEDPKKIGLRITIMGLDGKKVPGVKQFKVFSKVQDDGTLKTVQKKIPATNLMPGYGARVAINPKGFGLHANQRLYLDLGYSPILNGVISSRLNVSMGIETSVIEASVYPEGLTEIAIDNSDEIGMVEVKLLEQGEGKLTITYLDSQGQVQRVTYPIKCK